MSYADDITNTSTSKSSARKYIQPFLYTVFARTKHNNLTLNPDKATCPLLTPDPAEYKSNLDNKLHYPWQPNQRINMAGNFFDKQIYNSFFQKKLLIVSLLHVYLGILSPRI